MTKPLYQILGASETDDPATIAAAYRRLSKRFHPDKNPGDDAAAEHFKQIAEAFEILNDPGRRAGYDRTGEIPHSTEQADRREALRVLQSVIHQIVGKDLKHGVRTIQRKLLVDVGEVLDGAIEHIEHDLDKMRRAQTRLEEVAGRISSQDGQENLLAALTLEPVKKIEADIEQSQRYLAIHKLAWEILRQFNFRSDAPAASVWATGRQARGFMPDSANWREFVSGDFGWGD